MQHKSLSEYANNLRARGKVKNAYLTSSNLLTYEMDIHFNVLGVLMLNWIFREINDTNVVTIYQSSYYDGTM